MKNFIAKMGAALIVLMAVSASYAGTMKDRRDGKTYKTVKIGNQEWMAENLNYQTDESKCYDNKPENCEKYGRLYVWRDAVTACPDGWHLPSKQEFEKLVNTAGGEEAAGKALKSRSGWNESGNGTDGLGFGALPAGSYYSDDDDFHDEGGYALFWSSTEGNSNNAYFLYLDYFNVGAYVYNFSKGSGFSVRCVKNP